MSRRHNHNGAPKPGLIAALDIGSSKIAAFVARIDDSGHARVIGVGHQPSAGIKSGAVVDLDSARQAIVTAVHGAEKMADETVRSAVVAITCGKPRSETFGVDLAVAGREIADSDVKRLLDKAGRVDQSGEREELHRIPTGFRLDGVDGIRDPRAMYGDTLGVGVHTVTAEAAQLRTLATCIAGCHLEVRRFVLAPYAAGLGCLVPDEKDLGATVIDMGAGTTSVAIFEAGHLVHADVVPVGGGHISTDIAQGLSTPIGDAERIKILYGNALASPGESRSTLAVPQIGSAGAPPQQVPRALLTSIIRPRLEETFELVRARLEQAGRTRHMRRIVLTGGGSLLAGARETAASIFDCRVRVARPHRLDGLAEQATAPTFAACAGLLSPDAGLAEDGLKKALGALAALNRKEEKRGMIRRIGSWLHEHF
jgi:cell division protein FtsA